MGLVEQPGDGGEPSGRLERLMQYLAVGVVRVLLEVALASPAGDIALRANA